MPIQIFSRIKDGSLKHVSGSNNHTNIRYHYKKKTYQYEINKVWNNAETNTIIFEDLKERSKEYIKKYYVAFGYTGSGKTYTIYGVLFELLTYLSSVEGEIKGSAYQIYSNCVYDMLNKNKKLKIFKTDKLIIQSLTKDVMTDVNLFISKIKKHRKLASTNMNDVSSRSHAIINIYHSSHHYILIDMAGQESGVTGVKNEKMVQKQGRNINLDMLHVKECIRNFNADSEYLPFRRCLLTLIMKPMFLDKCYCAFICTISTKQNMYHQIDSFNYASALYNKKNDEEDGEFFELFHKYTDYINEIGWVGCQERNLWRQMRQGNQTNQFKMREYLNRKMKIMSQFNIILVKYEKIYP